MFTHSIETPDRHGSHRFATVARIWGSLFFSVGLVFLLLPSRAGAALDAITFSTWFRSFVGTGGGAVWKLSLLGGVASFYLLAFWASVKPQWRTPYVLLLTVSALWTLAFVSLAIVHAPVWGVPAFFSALCGLTLWLSHSDRPSSLAIDA